MTGEVDGNDEKAVQSKIQSAGSRRGNPRRENAQSTGFTIQGAPIQIAKWWKAALDQLPELFVDGRTRKASCEADNDALYEEIGRLKVELDWLKKKVGMLD